MADEDDTKPDLTWTALEPGGYQVTARQDGHTVTAEGWDAAEVKERALKALAAVLEADG